MKLNYFKNAFQAEWLKTKGLGLFYSAIALGIISPLIIFIVNLFNKNSRLFDGIKTIISTDYFEKLLSMFGSFFLIILIILAASRVCQTDHKNNGWIFMETQPLSKLSIYSAKFLSVFLLTTMSILAFLLSTALFSNIIQMIFPQDNYSFGIDLGLFLHQFIRLLVISLGIISLQLMLSVVIRGFVWPFMIGFMGFVINITAQIRQERYDFVPYNNVDTSLELKNSSFMSSFFSYSDILLLFWAVLFFVIGFMIYSRRGIKSAFFANKMTIGKSLFGLLAFVGLYFWITKPKYGEKLDGKTVIDVKYTSTLKEKTAKLYFSEIKKLIAEIPIKDGEIHWETKENLPLGYYTLAIGDNSYNFIMSKNDNIELLWNEDENSNNVVLKGSRIAETQFDPEKSRSIFNITRVDGSTPPEMFYDNAKDDWENQIKFLNNFRTIENYHLNPDFVEFQKQSFAVKMLNSIYDYRAENSLTDKKYEAPKEFLNELSTVLKKPSDLLITSNEYNNWKLKSLLPAEGSKNPDSLIMIKLSQMPKSKEKDRLLSSQLINYFELTNDKAKREEVMMKNADQFQNPDFAKFVAAELQVINNQQKGATLPPLIFEDKDGGKVSFSDFKGKFVIIDFWATWCGPCKITRPQFEFKANKLSYAKDIVFVAISIDEDKAKWKSAVKNDQSKVKQLWIGKNPMLHALNVNSIPRFMMIDKEGKMFNANMPRPSDSNFEEIIDEASSTKIVKF